MRVEPNIGLMMKLQNRKAMLQSLPAFLVDQTWVFIMLGCWSLSSCHLRFGFFFASFASLSLWSKWKVARVFGAFDRFATALHWNRLIQLQRRGVTKVSSWNAWSDEFQTFVWGGHIFWIYCWDKPTDLCLYFKPNLLRNNVFSLLQTGALAADFPFPWVGHVSSLDSTIAERSWDILGWVFTKSSKIPSLDDYCLTCRGCCHSWSMFHDLGFLEGGRMGSDPLA